MVSVKDEIVARLTTLHPQDLQVIDDSAAHAGHRGASEHFANTGVRDGSHFEIRIVSQQFVGMNLVARHRMIYQLLDDLMKSRIHALKIDARAT